MSIGRALRWWCERDPDRPALTCAERTLTRRELDRRSNRLARAFAQMGVGQDDLVVVSLANGIAFVECVLAAAKLGAKVMPMPAQMPAAERDPVLELVRPALVVGADARSLRGAPGVSDVDGLAEGYSDASLPDAVANPWFATVSGGSTGRPKVIVNRQPGLFDPEVPEAGLASERATLIPGPLYHGAPFHTGLRALLFGNHLVVMKKFDPEGCLALLASHRVDFVPVVPTMMIRMWRLGPEVRARYDLSSLRILVSMGAACPAWVKEAWIGWIGAGRVHEYYTCTEQIGMTWISGTEWLEHRGSVGRPIHGSRVKIFTREGREAAPGEIGEIHLIPAGGPGSSYSYIGAEPRRRADGWESCGDLGWLDADGYLYVADRRTDMIVTGGENVYPAEVEAVLDQHPAVRSSAVIGLPDDDLGQRVHAIVECEPGIGADDLKAWLDARLARYKVPRSYELGREALRNEAGKLRRSALRQARIGG